MDSTNKNDKVGKKQHKQLRHNQELANPCLKEHHLSLKCLDDNNYDHDACTLYFANYKNCKAFWNQVVQDRRTKGITPVLPIPEEREEIKKIYMNKNV